MSIWLGKRKTIKQTFRLRLKTLVASFMGLVFLTSICFADGGYLTTYSHHIKRRELEVMAMNDFTFPSKPHREEGERNYFSHMVEVEYAPFSQLALEWMTEWFEDVGTGHTKFTGFRYEARYRLFKKEIPLNPMLYVEYEDLDPETRYKMEVSGWVKPPYEDSEDGAETTHPEDEGADRERIIETRVILSQDFLKHWNAAFNWINETDTSDGVTAFGYTTGVSYQFHTHHEEHAEHAHHSSHHDPFFSIASVALELTGAFGDTKDFGLEPSRQEHYVQPSVMFHLGKHTMINLGFAIGLSRSSDNVARFNVGVEF